MYIIYLWANLWIFSVLTLIPVLGITLLTGTIDTENIFIRVIIFLWIAIIGLLSHTSALNQCQKDVDIIKGIKMGYQDLIIYLKIFLKFD